MVDVCVFTLNLLYMSVFLSVFSKTRFRWFQESSVHRDVPAFALDSVYISEPCPNHCGGYGDCISGVCFCDMGYTGNWTCLLLHWLFTHYCGSVLKVPWSNVLFCVFSSGG